MTRFKDNEIESLNSKDNFTLPKLHLKRSSINTDQNMNSKNIYKTISSPNMPKLDQSNSTSSRPNSKLRIINEITRNENVGIYGN